MNFHDDRKRIEKEEVVIIAHPKIPFGQNKYMLKQVTSLIETTIYCCRMMLIMLENYYYLMNSTNHFHCCLMKIFIKKVTLTK
jgi:hypothetical protein